jgi:hypothetical protein
MDNRGYFSGGGVGEVYYGFEIRWKPADDPQEEVLEVGEVRVFREVAPLRAWLANGRGSRRWMLLPEVPEEGEWRDEDDPLLRGRPDA